jgi:hypothetical protein
MYNSNIFIEQVPDDDESQSDDKGDEMDRVIKIIFQIRLDVAAEVHDLGQQKQAPKCLKG